LVRTPLVAFSDRAGFFPHEKRPDADALADPFSRVGKMTLCGEWTAVKEAPTQHVAITLRCRSWTCDECRIMRKRQLVAMGCGGKPTKFLTLTSRKRDDMTEEEAAAQLVWAWRVLRKRIIRKKKLSKLPFLAVIERHKSGWPHLHLLLRMPFLSQSWISKQMAGLCDGPNVWIEHLWDTKKAAAYCAKYCSKCTQKIGTSKRYWQSKDYDLRSKNRGKALDTSSSPWEVCDFSLQSFLEVWRVMGWTVNQRSRFCVEAVPPTAGQSP